jgi:hypothetical protein
MVDPRFDASPSEDNVGDPSWICIIVIPAICVELIKPDNRCDNTPNQGQFQLELQGCEIRTDCPPGM